MLNQFIEMAVSQLDVNPQSAQKASEGIMGMLKSQMDTGDFAELNEAVPGAADAAANQSGGLMSGLAGMIGGQSMGALATLADSGLSGEKIGPFVQLFLSFVKSKAGEGLLQKVMAAAPELAKLFEAQPR